MSLPNVGNHSTKGRKRPLDVPGPVRGRSLCWRAECRRAYGSYRTITYRGGIIEAHCHDARYGADLDLRAELWRTFRDLAA